MPKASPRDFRDDVVAISRRRESSFGQIARDFGISESWVQRWVRIAEVDDGLKLGGSSAEQAENCELKRVRLLEQENRGAASSGRARGVTSANRA